jgi:hypothetical protein
MLTPDSRIIRVADRDGALSPAHKTFNRQIKQIAKLRDKLAAWESAASRYRSKYVRDLAPLLARMTELRIELVHALDRGSGHKALSVPQQRKLSQAIVEIADIVLDERDDASVKAIYNKHSPVDYDSEAAAHTEEVKDFLENMFDLDLGEAEEHDSVDDLFERAREQFREKQQAEQQADEERHSQRKKTAREIEREARADADAKRVSQSVREVYRKLVSELHPDRETDPQERARKTELMQRINQAYGKRNLLQLLELQLELEHIDEQYLAGLDTERLRHFNAVLREQIAELKQELVAMEMRFREQFSIHPHGDLDPRTMVRDLEYDVFSAERENRALGEEIALAAEAKGLKAWLKSYRRIRRHEPDADALF